MTSQNTYPCSAWLKLKVCVRAVCFFASLHSTTYFPPSLLSLHEHFEPILTLSAPTHTDNTDNTAEHILNETVFLPVPKPRDKRHSLRAAGSLSIWRTPPTPQVMSPRCSSTRPSLRTATRRPSTIQTATTSQTSPESHVKALDSSVF